MNSMGALFSDIEAEYRILWIQAVCYFILALCVYRFQIYRSRRIALQRLDELRASRKN